jgi:hyaluronoglucosaminidase
VVDRKEVALSTLPSSVSFTTIGKKTVSVPVVQWVCDDYNRLEAGWNTFTAQLDVSGLTGVSNALRLTATAKVWVSAGFDGAALQEYIDIAASLDPYDFTEDSWKEVEQKLQTAIEIMSNPFTVQNSINVASFQLRDAINALVNINQNKSALNELLATCVYESDDYTAASFANYERYLQVAQNAAASNIVSQYEINEATVNLQTAISKLIAVYDKNALLTAINQAKAIDSSLYTADSYAKLTQSITQAESVLAMTEITYTLGELVMDDLQSAIDGLKTIEQPSASDSSSTNTDENAGGCASVMDTASASLALAGVAVMALRKKKDDE